VVKSRDPTAQHRARTLVTSSNVNPFEEEWRFLRGLFARPRHVGAIAPSSPELARAIAGEIDPDRPGPVLELGPGTGVVTAALIDRGVAPERIIAIEYDPEFASHVGQRFPKVRVIQGDAFALAGTLGNGGHARFAGIVSGIPLLNHPPARRNALIQSALAHLTEGAPFVQFSYGLTPPIAPPAGIKVSLAAFVWKNLPPARVWVYRKV
jgi:phosphatidylethanolamine/phosphatidyl-N-methylethanolamine N-methyltransferase